MKHVFSMETEREKDLQTLAETIVSCQLKRKGRFCNSSRCADCPTLWELDACMKQLPACDSLRVKNLAQELYSLRAFQYGLDKPSARYILRETGKCILWAIAILAVTVGAGALMLAAALLPILLGT